MKLTNELVIEKARQLGFDIVGFAKAELLIEEISHLEEWLKRNYHASMEYMERNLHKRKDVSEILPGAKTVISLGINYYVDDHFDDQSEMKISRYAWGKDYHLVLWDKLQQLEEELKSIDPSFESKSYVDTGPVMDKVWAVRAGLGWMGKHTNVINKNIGSWFFISNIITNYEFFPSDIITDHCGTCTACIDACPTNAIVDEYLLDAAKCISYLTIENKNEIPEEFKGKFDNWVFGGDICQDVCPWNIKFSAETQNIDFTPKNKNLSFKEITEMDDEEFKKRFADSPIKRTKLKGLKRNADFLKVHKFN